VADAGANPALLMLGAPVMLRLTPAVSHREVCSWAGNTFEPGMAGHAVPGFCSIGAGMVGNRAGIEREATSCPPASPAKNECAPRVADQSPSELAYCDHVMVGKASSRPSRVTRLNVGTSLEPLAGSNQAAPCGFQKILT
jgi:hypothetical protein